MDEDVSYVRFRIIYPILKCKLDVIGCSYDNICNNNEYDGIRINDMNPGERFVIPRDQKLDGL